MILVSACLLGIRSRYDGQTNAKSELIPLCQRGLAIPVCPEQLGGLPTPRPPAEIQGGDGAAVLAGQAVVVNAAGRDVTSAFVAGAKEALKIAILYGADTAILKARSPSCGYGSIYDGTFSHQLQNGDGVTTAILRTHGLSVYTEEQVTPELLRRLVYDNSNCPALRGPRQPTGG
ncbi:MAG: DUF523 domain-containing protein [Firmicutes bacterium]|nr:DUF523 domain-containing protein [Bacillota bacterium]